MVGTSAAVAIVLGEPGREELAVYLENALAVPVDADLAVRAMSGWRRYGTGHHPAGSILATASHTRSPSGPGTPC